MIHHDHWDPTAVPGMFRAGKAGMEAGETDPETPKILGGADAGATEDSGVVAVAGPAWAKGMCVLPFCSCSTRHRCTATN
jgi:hypothetical protein